MFKNFPKTRVCVVDIRPLIVKGFQQASLFTKKHNISLSSRDGKNIIITFCLKYIKETYNKIQSPYQKTVCLSNKKLSQKIISFVEDQITKQLKQNSIIYCGQYDLSSPDVEIAARNCVDNYKQTNKRITDIVKGLNLGSVN